MFSLKKSEVDSSTSKGKNHPAVVLQQMYAPKLHVMQNIICCKCNECTRKLHRPELFLYIYIRIGREVFVLQFRNLRNHLNKEDELRDDLNSVKSRPSMSLCGYTLLLFLFSFILFKRDDPACSSAAVAHSSVKRFDGRNVNRMKRGRYFLLCIIHKVN